MLLRLRFLRFFKSKKRDFLRFLLCFTRFLELCTSLVSEVWQRKLVSGWGAWGLWKRRSAAPDELYGSGRTFLSFYIFLLIYWLTHYFEWMNEWVNEWNSVADMAGICQAGSWWDGYWCCGILISWWRRHWQTNDTWTGYTQVRVCMNHVSLCLSVALQQMLVSGARFSFIGHPSMCIVHGYVAVIFTHAN